MSGSTSKQCERGRAQKFLVVHEHPPSNPTPPHPIPQEAYKTALAYNGEELEGRSLKVREGGEGQAAQWPLHEFKPS